MRELIFQLFYNKVFRYFIAAGLATVVDVCMYYSMFHFVLHETNIALDDEIVIGAPSISLLVSYSCGLVTNFSISKYWVFHESELRGSHQFFRFVMVALTVLVANYFFMNFLIKSMGWFPTLSRAVSAVTIGVFSFLAHKVFSFKM